MATNKSHTSYNQLVDALKEVARTEAEVGHAPRQGVSDELVPYPFVDGRIAEEAPVGNEHPDAMDLAKCTKSRVKPLGQEGGKIAGKKGDKLNPSGDQDDDENGSVHPDQHMPVNSTAWHDVVRSNLGKRKRATRQDEPLDEDERRQIVEEVQGIIASRESAVLAEDMIAMAELIETLEADVEELQEERDALHAANLKAQLLIHIRDLSRSMTLMQADRFLKMAVDHEDIERMATDAEYCARVLGRLKEQVVESSKRPSRTNRDLTKGFADPDYRELRGEQVAPISDARMSAVRDAMKIFR